MKVREIPIIGPILSNMASAVYKRRYFKNSSDYWENRYKSGGNSGSGSYNQLAIFKAEIINSFVKKNNITTVVELGCGDANQLKMFQLQNYTGYDISQTILDSCSEKFANDNSKQFKHISNFIPKKTDLIMSLDVIYHLVEDAIFESHMQALFNSNNKYIVIYSSNFNDSFDEVKSPHVRHRKFTSWAENKAQQFRLDKHIPNKHQYKGDETVGSLADFYFYSQIDA
jgi:hypothetical protein